MTEPRDEIVCVPVRYPTGELVYEPVAEYRANPPRDSYIDRESRAKSLFDGILWHAPGCRAGDYQACTCR